MGQKRQSDKQKIGDMKEMKINVIRTKGEAFGLCENCANHARHNAPKKEYNYIQLSNETIRYQKETSELENYENMPQHLFCSDCSQLVETIEEEYVEPLF